jgi:hypothetical protein
MKFKSFLMENSCRNNSFFIPLIPVVFLLYSFNNGFYLWRNCPLRGHSHQQIANVFLPKIRRAPVHFRVTVFMLGEDDRATPRTIKAHPGDAVGSWF